MHDRACITRSLGMSVLLALFASGCNAAPADKTGDAPKREVEPSITDSASTPAEDKVNTPIENGATPPAENDAPEPPSAVDAPTVTDDITAPSIPASILPVGCTAGPWNGEKQFEIGCQKPRRKGWTKVAKVESFGAGSAYVSHAYRKDGWMLLFGEQCCSSCSASGLSECEPWFTARLYPPSDLVDCKKSKLCAQVGMCVQKPGWCGASGREWGLSM